MRVIVRRLDELREEWSLLHSGKSSPPLRLGVWLDRRLEARAAVTLLVVLGERYEIGLLAVGPSLQSAPPPIPDRVSRVVARIRAATEPSQKFRMVADAFGVALQGCVGHQRFFDGLESTTLNRERLVHAAIVDSLADCSCVGADLDMIEALVVGDEPPLIHLEPIRFRQTAAQIIQLSEGATVQELVEQVAARPGSVMVRWTSGRVP
jgi:hypothetical protein